MPKSTSEFKKPMKVGMAINVHAVFTRCVYHNLVLLKVLGFTMTYHSRTSKNSQDIVNAFLILSKNFMPCMEILIIKSGVQTIR